MDLLRPYQVDRSHLTLNGKWPGACLQFPLSNEQWPRAPASKCWWHELLLSRSVKKRGSLLIGWKQRPWSGPWNRFSASCPVSKVLVKYSSTNCSAVTLYGGGFVEQCLEQPKLQRGTWNVPMAQDRPAVYETEWMLADLEFACLYCRLVVLSLTQACCKLLSAWELFLATAKNFFPQISPGGK